MTPIELLKFMLPDFLVEYFEVVSDQVQKRLSIINISLRKIKA